MQEEHNKHFNNFDDEIDLQELFYVLLQGKWIIVSTSAFLSIIGLIYSLLLPNIYESKALLVPVNISTGMSSSLQGYGGLAGLAGISLPSGGNEGNAEKAIKKISSFSFFKNNLQENILLQDLMAVDSWNSATNKLIYNNRKYKNKTNTWVRSYSYPQKQIPSAQESFKVFIDDHLRLSVDKKNAFISISIKHQSPFIAKQWTELVVNEVNSFYRQKDRSGSEKAVNYLNQQIQMTGLAEIKQVIAELIQEETQKLTLIEVNEFYVFDYIDPPVVMEEKSEPKRSLIIILCAILGAMLGIALVLIQHYRFKKKDS